MTRWHGKRPALTPDEAASLRRMVREGRLHREVAAAFGINRRTVGAYVRGEHKRKELAA